MHMKNIIIAVIKYETVLLTQRMSINVQCTAIKIINGCPWSLPKATLPMLARLLISLRRFANQL